MAPAELSRRQSLRLIPDRPERRHRWDGFQPRPVALRFPAHEQMLARLSDLLSQGQPTRRRASGGRMRSSL